MKRLLALAAVAVCLSTVFLVARAAEPAAGPAPLVVETIAGNGYEEDLPAGGGKALDVPVSQPFGVELGPDGALYIASVGQHRVLRLDRTSGQLTSVAGSGVKGYSGDGELATAAQLNEPYEVRFDADKNMIFVEMQNHLIRRVDAKTGVISTIAGAPTPGYEGDGGSARAARFRQPHSIALDDRGNVYVADIGNHRIRRINLAAGTIDSIAGNGRKELPRDGSIAADNPIFGPRALAIVGRTLWVALREGNSVWRIDLDSNIIRHVAGTGRAGYGGDGGSLKLATFNGPKGIAATIMGAVYVVDSENQAVRLIDTARGTIETVAGGGPATRGFAGDHGSSRSAWFDRPHGIGLAPDGGFFIGDTNNHRVRWVHR